MLILLSMPSNMGLEILPAQFNTSIYISTHTNLFYWIRHVLPDSPEFFVSTRVERFLMRDRESLEHCGKSLDFVEL